MDRQKYRVTWICKCSTDYAEGYGPSIAVARTSVRKFWRKGGHRIKDLAEEIVERVSTDGSHYELHERGQ